MKKEYRPKTFEQELGYLVEESGEVLAAAGKTLRWGVSSVNPELAPDEQEENGDWLMRELDDLARAIGMVRTTLQSLGYRRSLMPAHKATDESLLSALERLLNECGMTARIELPAHLKGDS